MYLERLLTAYGDGATSMDGGVNPVSRDVVAAEIVNIHRLRLYRGHVNYDGPFGETLREALLVVGRNGSREPVEAIVEKIMERHKRCMKNARGKQQDDSLIRSHLTLALRAAEKRSLGAVNG